MQVKKYVGVALKVAVTLFSLWYIFQQLDPQETWHQMKQVGLGFFLGGVFFYLLSQLVSSFRLNTFLGVIDARLPWVYNFYLYLIGMAYNFFLPGGIGGDGYKVYLLKKHKETSTKKSITALLFDRLIGLLAILIVLGVLIFTNDGVLFAYKTLLMMAYLILGIFIPFIILKRFWTAYSPVYLQTLFSSLVIQGLQLVTIYFLWKGLQIDVAFHWIALVFFVSTIATAIPIFFGGLGAREVVFAAFTTSVYWTGSNPTQMVSIAVLFSLVTLLSAIPGLFLNWQVKHGEYLG